MDADAVELSLRQCLLAPRLHPCGWGADIDESIREVTW
jgi:hypothetical protein